MRLSRPNKGLSRGPFIAVLAIFACALAGCSSTSAERSPGSGASKDASPAAARAAISKICLREPEKYFGVGKKTTKAHCDCYAAGVTKRLSKDEFSYVVAYNEIPSLSQDQYDQVLEACVGGVAPADKAAAKKQP